MDGAHIAFITLPHSPHVFPTVSLVSALIKRGYRVTYATSESFSQIMKDAGAEILHCPPFRFRISSDDDHSPGNATQEDPLIDYTTQMLESITSFLDKNRPALILYDFLAFAGRILSNRWAIPAIQTSPFYALEKNDLYRQVPHNVFRNVLQGHARVIAAFLHSHGVDSTNYRTDKERLNIYLFPRALQPNSSRFGSDCFFAGRCAIQRPSTADWQDHSNGRPVALVSMSTLFSVPGNAAQLPEYYRMCIEAFSGLGWHVVLSIGESCDSTSLMPLPKHCEIIRPAAYLKALSRANLLLFMSGIVSTTEAAFHGVPMIALTNGVSEFEWQADHLVKLGIGAHIRKADSNVVNLRNVVLQISRDPIVIKRVNEVRSIVSQEPGAEETASRVIEYLDKCGVTR